MLKFSTKEISEKNKEKYQALTKQDKDYLSCLDRFAITNDEQYNLIHSNLEAVAEKYGYGDCQIHNDWRFYDIKDGVVRFTNSTLTSYLFLAYLDNQKCKEVMNLLGVLASLSQLASVDRNAYNHDKKTSYLLDWIDYRDEVKLQYNCTDLNLVDKWNINNEDNSGLSEWNIDDSVYGNDNPEFSDLILYTENYCEIDCIDNRFYQKGFFFDYPDLTAFIESQMLEFEDPMSEQEQDDYLDSCLEEASHYKTNCLKVNYIQVFRPEHVCYLYSFSSYKILFKTQIRILKENLGLELELDKYGESYLKSIVDDKEKEENEKMSAGYDHIRKYEIMGADGPNWDYNTYIPISGPSYDGIIIDTSANSNNRIYPKTVVLDAYNSHQEEVYRNSVKDKQKLEEETEKYKQKLIEAAISTASIIPSKEDGKGKEKWLIIWFKNQSVKVLRLF
jgi:hypothetical protein